MVHFTSCPWYLLVFNIEYLIQLLLNNDLNHSLVLILEYLAFPFK